MVSTEEIKKMLSLLSMDCVSMSFKWADYIQDTHCMKWSELGVDKLQSILRTKNVVESLLEKDTGLCSRLAEQARINLNVSRIAKQSLFATLARMIYDLDGDKLRRLALASANYRRVLAAQHIYELEGLENEINC